MVKKILSTEASYYLGTLCVDQGVLPFSSPPWKQGWGHGAQGTDVEWGCEEQKWKGVEGHEGPPNTACHTTSYSGTQKLYFCVGPKIQKS